jgi:hypothetical protein
LLLTVSKFPVPDLLALVAVNPKATVSSKASITFDEEIRSPTLTFVNGRIISRPGRASNTSVQRPGQKISLRPPDGAIYLRPSPPHKSGYALAVSFMKMADGIFSLLRPLISINLLKGALGGRAPTAKP